MKTSTKLLLLFSFALTSHSKAVLTTNLIAYWDFEGSGNNNTALASGGAAYNLTLANGATAGGTGKSGQGLQLDGVNDYATVGSNVNVNQPWTISAWFRSDISPLGTVREMVYESYATTTTGFSMSFGLREGAPTTGTAYELFADGVSTDKSQQAQVTDANTGNVWHHIISTYNPSTRQTLAYLDGSATPTYTLTLNVGDTLVPVAGLRLGTYRGADTRFFDGTIDEVALWNRALTASELSEVYSLGAASRPVPEPAVALLGGLGLFGLLRRRR